MFYSVGSLAKIRRKNEIELGFLHKGESPGGKEKEVEEERIGRRREKRKKRKKWKKRETGECRILGQAIVR